jgi:GPH family glycoside/pentoside/hexuronide:cation symporter
MMNALLVRYAGISLPMAFLGLPLYVYVPITYAEISAIGLTTAGIVIFIARLLDVVTDPLMGWLQDRFRDYFSPKYWMMLSIPILIAGVFYLFNPTPDSSLGYLAMAVTATYLGWTMLSIPYLALGSEIGRNTQMRRKVALWRESGVLLGGLLALVTVALLSDSPLEAMSQLFIVLLLLTVMLIVTMPNKPISTQSASSLSSWALLRNSIGLKPLLGLHFINALAAGIPATLFIVFAEEIVAVTDAEMGILLLTYFLSGLLTLPLWNRIAQRVGVISTWRLSLLLAIVGFIPVFILGQEDLMLYWWVCVITGASLGADMALPSSLLAKVLQDHSKQSGLSQEASGFGLWGMAGKLALAAAVGISFPLLDIATDLQAREGALIMLYAAIPILLKFIVWMLLLKLGLDDQEKKDETVRA